MNRDKVKRTFNDFRITTYKWIFELVFPNDVQSDCEKRNFELIVLTISGYYMRKLTNPGVSFHYCGQKREKLLQYRKRKSSVIVNQENYRVLNGKEKCYV